MSFKEYCITVADSAIKLGYTYKQVEMFLLDIQECFNNGKTVEQCIDIVF